MGNVMARLSNFGASVLLKTVMYTLAVHPLVLSRTMSVQFPAAFTVKTLAVFKGPLGTSVEVPGPIKVCVILEPGGELCEFTN